MRLALTLAGRGRGFTSPNPMVGAVLAKDDKVVGVGYHRCFGGPHAEVEVLREAGKRARGADLYVIMEPCCFCGKTGACTDALKAAGVRQVYAATLDPHPRVRGRGIRCLRQAGIEVSVGLLANEARRLNEAYFTFHRRRRPFVTLKVGLTLDGMMADAAGRSQWITGERARQRAQELRRLADAVLVGVDTVAADDPRLDCRLPRHRPVLKVVLDSELRTPVRSRLLSTPGPVLILTAGRNRARRAGLERRGAEVVPVRRTARGLLSWKSILAELYRRQVTSVLVEGGATVASSALEAGVVDKVCAIHAPKFLGPGRGVTAAMRGRTLGQAIALVRVSHEVLGDDVMTVGHLGK